jgi:hypothetical protein
MRGRDLGVTLRALNPGAVSTSMSTSLPAWCLSPMDCSTCTSAFMKAHANEEAMPTMKSVFDETDEDEESARWEAERLEEGRAVPHEEVAVAQILGRLKDARRNPGDPGYLD